MTPLSLFKADRLRSQLLRGGMGSFALKVSNTALAMGLAIILARALGPGGYGIYAFAFSLVTVLAIPAQFGLPTLVLREAARYQYRDEWGSLRGLLRWTNKAVGVVSAILVLVAASIAWGVWNEPESRAQLHTFLWALTLVPLLSLGNLRGAALRGLRQIVRGQMPEMFFRPGVFLLLVLIVWQKGWLTPTVAMTLHAVAAAVAFAVGVFLLLRAVGPHMRGVKPNYETRLWLKSVLPLSFLAGMLVISKQTDIVMLGILASDEEVGVYRVSVQGAGMVTFGLVVVNMVVGPHFARMYEARDFEKLQRLVTAAARVSFLAAIPVAFVLAIFGRPILDFVFGPGYSAGHFAMAILAAGELVSAGAGSVGYLLNMTGNERDMALIVTIAAGSNILLNLLLIPYFGMVGAAVASFLTLTVLNAILCWRVWHRLGIKASAFMRQGDLPPSTFAPE